ncbi:MAG: signal peptide peptidase SppA [Rickettsiales bacterium]|jgi:protease-4
MGINADTLIDRLYLKAQINKWRGLAMLFAIATLLIASYGAIPSKTKDNDYIARFTLSGVIGDDQKIYNLISSIEDDKKIKAVIVWLDTPGGSAVGGEEIYLRLRKLSEKKPVVAVMRSISASAGYMIALGTERIFARAGTITGSIGVLIQTAEVTDLAEKLGIKPISIKSSPLKASPSPFEKSSPEGERVLKDMIMDFYDHFVSITAERRNLTHEKALILADGRVYSGTQAVKNKLIDEIGGEDEAKNWLVENRGISKNLSIFDVEVESENTLLDKMLNSIVGEFWQKSRVGLDGLVALWHH